MEHCSSRHVKLQKNLDVVELKQVWNNKDVEAICCSIVAAATTKVMMNEVSHVR